MNPRTAPRRARSRRFAAGLLGGWLRGGLARAVARAVVVLLVLATGATACARSTGGVSAGTDIGNVTVACGAAEDWCTAMTNAFNRSHPGLHAKYVRLSSGEALARIRASKDKPEFDVWHGGPADGYVAAADEGLLEPYVSPNASKIPIRYKDAAGNWTGVYVGVLGFCSNIKILAEKHVAVPRSWDDLLNPALAKSVGIAHPLTSGTAYTALWTQVVLRGGQDAAIAYAKKLHANVLQYSQAGAGPVGQVARGEVAVGVVFSHDCVAGQVEGYKDLTVSFPREGTGYETGGVALIRGARSPVSAKKYIDWALTAQAQEIGPTVKAYQVPTNPDATVSAQVVDLRTVNLVPYDVVSAGAAKPVLSQRFDTEVASAPKA